MDARVEEIVHGDEHEIWCDVRARVMEMTCNFFLVKYELYPNCDLFKVYAAICLYIWKI